MSSKYDITLNGIQYRIKRGEEPGYRRRYARQFVQEPVPVGSRIDNAHFWQTSWIGGATWWKPLVDAGDDTYYVAQHISSYGKPGYLAPINDVTETAATSVANRSSLVVVENDVFAIGTTQNVSASYYDVYKMAQGGATFVQETGYSGNESNITHGLIYNDVDNYVYCLGPSYLSRFKPSTGDEDQNWTSLSETRVGANVQVFNGRVLVYTGTRIYEINTSTGVATEVANDLMGKDFLSNASLGAGDRAWSKSEVRLMVATPTGVYYVKNVAQDGLPVPWVFRFSRDTAGNDINEPIGNLPRGNVALGITEHLGAIVITASPDWRSVLRNDSDFYFRVGLYTIVADSINSLGLFQGDDADESPFVLLGALTQHLFIGGQKRIWVYDAVRGGIHPIIKATETTAGAYHSMVQHDAGTGDEEAMIIYGDQTLLQTSVLDLPPRPGTGSTSATYYILESNYFDFGLPFEDKTLVQVEVQTDGLATGVAYLVDVETDDAGSWTQVLNHTSGKSASATISGQTGKRFRYRIRMTSSAGNLSDFRGLMFTAIQGKMVRIWELTLDGGEIRNVENVVLRPSDAFDNIDTAATSEAPITLIDGYHDEDVTDTSTHTVKVLDASIIKNTRAEADIDVRLAEVTP